MIYSVMLHKFNMFELLYSIICLLQNCSEIKALTQQFQESCMLSQVCLQLLLNKPTALACFRRHNQVISIWNKIK